MHLLEVVIFRNIQEQEKWEPMRARNGGLVTITAEWRSWIGGHEAQSGATTTHRFMGLRVNWNMQMPVVSVWCGIDGSWHVHFILVSHWCKPIRCKVGRLWLVALEISSSAWDGCAWTLWTLTHNSWSADTLSWLVNVKSRGLIWGLGLVEWIAWGVGALFSFPVDTYQASLLVRSDVNTIPHTPNISYYPDQQWISDTSSCWRIKSEIVRWRGIVSVKEWNHVTYGK